MNEPYEELLKRIASLEGSLGLEYVERDEMTFERQTVVAAADHVSAHIEARDGRRGGARVSQIQWRELARQAVEALLGAKGELTEHTRLIRKSLEVNAGAVAASRAMVDLHREAEAFQKDVFLYQQGLTTFDLRNDGQGGATLVFRALTQEEIEERDAPEGEPAIRWLPTDRRDHKAGNEVYSWVFAPPPAYSDVAIVCTPDAESPIGMRCLAEKKLVGGERVNYLMKVEEPS
jgi:hypothetical protein